jgi:orotate phosphoribosyltransferase
MKAFSIRKEPKDHGTGGRLVGPVGTGDRVCVVEDTMTTGGSTVSAIEVLRDAGIDVAQVVTVVDRSGGSAEAAIAALGLDLIALVTAADLEVVG